MKPWKLFSGCITLFWLVLAFAPSQAQSDLAQIAITGVTYDSYPQVNVQVRAVNENGKPITGLGTSSFEVTEDGTPQTVSVSSTEGSIYVHFVIDAGSAMSGERWLRAQNAILSFVTNDPRMGEGDIVEVSVLEDEGGRQILPPTPFSGKENIVQVVSNYSPSSTTGTAYRADLNFIQTWVDSLVGNRAVEGRPTIIVVITANFGLYSTQVINSVATSAKASATPIYTLFVREDAPAGIVDPVRSLASESGGEHFHVQNNAVLVPAYDSLEAYRQQYVLSYDSRGSLSGTRRVQVSAGDGVEATANYDVQLQPPVVTITEPTADQTIARVSAEFVPEDQLSIIAPTEQTVRATVEFPDGYPRRLNNAELFINGTPAGTATGTRELEFIWDLREEQQVGDTTYQLVVAVEDVLGLVGTQEVNSTVQLFVPREDDNIVDVQATMEAMGFITKGGVITTTVVVTNTVGTVTPCTFSENQGWTWGCSTEQFVRDDWPSIIAIVVSICAVAFVTTSKSAPAQNIRNTVRHAAERLTNRYRKQAVRAYLYVEEGDAALVGQNLEVYGDTPIGRSLEVAQIIFHQTNPNTPISRLHCTLLDKEDHFEIQDEDSANGTIVNGKRLGKLDPYRLQEGDTIELAPVARGGVRLRFRLALEGDSGDMTQAEGGIRTTRDTRNSSNQKDAFDD